MDLTNSSIFVLIAAVLGLACIYPGARMIHRSYYTCEGWHRLLVVLGSLALTLLLAWLFFYLPFWVHRGQGLDRDAAVIEFVIYAVCPLGALAFGGWVYDSFADGHRSEVLCIAASACFALTLLFPAYFFFSSATMERFGIAMELVADE